jgi:hypothetical protein
VASIGHPGDQEGSEVNDRSDNTEHSGEIDAAYIRKHSETVLTE